MTKWIDFCSSNWDRIERDWTSWWNGTLQRPIIVIESISPQSNLTLSDIKPHLTQFGFEEPVGPILSKIEQNLNKLDYSGDAFPRWHPNFGTGFVALLLGSKPEFIDGTTWYHPAEPESFLTLDEKIDPNNPWLIQMEKFIAFANSNWRKFVLGHTDIGGNLDLLASLRGSQKTLFDLVENPMQVNSWLTQITKVWLNFFNFFESYIPTLQNGQSGWAPIWAPGRTYMLQCDFSAMISPKMFEKFVVPDLQSCCDHIDYPFYHLDGPGAIRHIDSLIKIEKLKGIQWIPGAGAPPAEEWLPLLEKIRNAGKLCQLFCSLEGAIKIAQSIGGQGFAFCIGDGRFSTPDESQKCLDYFL
ncbi:MAG: hypothetical protein CVU46_12995 [Chloroflexi bacterium HGW-Chloroflexi-8]|jgi:5-methyltetrahydrofolate--homocysteine methyltransferase|nr:MAG: hypothetical protein CVU46_12995 [Chloroflexi bacterium HGW-Chloroflexi-8]